MTSADFGAYRHRAVHKLMDLNKECEKNFRIGHWEQWDYDLDTATLTFSDSRVPRIKAQIQALGTTSKASKTWLWALANKSLPSVATAKLEDVRKFGRDENVAELTESTLPDDENLAWEMTAVAAEIIGAKGAYRCPNERGGFFTDVVRAANHAAAGVRSRTS